MNGTENCGLVPLTQLVYSEMPHFFSWSNTVDASNIIRESSAEFYVYVYGDYPSLCFSRCICVGSVLLVLLLSFFREEEE